MIQKLEGTYFKFIGEDHRKIGLIAQQVQEILPEVVYDDGTGYLSVSYGSIVALLIEGMKEEIKRNASESEHVQSRLAKIEATLERLLQ